MWFASIPIRGLARRRARSTLTVGGIAVAIGAFIALTGLSRSLERAWVNSLFDRGTHIVAVQKGAVEILTASIDQDGADDLRRVAGVEAVAGELIDLMKLKGGKAALVVGWPADCYLWGSLSLTDGRLPHADDTYALALGQTMAEALAKKPGDKIRLSRRECTVSGIFKQAGTMMNSSIVMPLSAMQAMLRRDGEVTAFNIRLEEPGDPALVSSIKARLDEAFPGLTFSESSQIADNNHIMQVLGAMTWGTSAVALAIGAVMVLNTLLMSVMERTHEIGVLSAVGWRAPRILAMIILEGMLLTFAGSAIGAALGIGGLHWLAGLPRIQGFLEPEVTLRLVVETSLAAFVLGLLGSIYPAWRAVRWSPVDALRHE